MLDLDIKIFFETIDWELLLRRGADTPTAKWVLLYIERWLKASVYMPDGMLVTRKQGTPQGAVISPLPANLFLHYGFDDWMTRYYADIPFECYADDSSHCRSEVQA